MSHRVVFGSIDRDELDRVLAARVDHGGNDVEPFTDADGGWPLRCCLTDSEPGDRLALIAWSPFPWSGPYREVGPIVVHHDGCARLPPLDALPSELDRRAMVLRPYTNQRRIAYDRVRHVPAGGSLTEHVRAILDGDEIEFVHGRNVVGGCYSFVAARG